MGAEAESLLVNRHRTKLDTDVIIKKNFSDEETDHKKHSSVDYLQERIAIERVPDTDNNGNDDNGNHSNNSTNDMTNKPKVILDKSNLLPADIGTDFNFKRKIVWKNAIGFLFLHLLAVYGLIIQLLGYADFRTILYTTFLIIASGMGVTMGAHRLFTHRSFKAKTWVRVFLLWMHTMAGQNCMYVWVRDHRQHHKYSDTDADPHNASRGFFFSHVGWLMSKKHPLVIEYGKKIDMSDMEADPWIMFQKKYYKTMYLIFTVLIPTSIPIIFWNESYLVSLFTTYFYRTVVQLNFTWCVNSVAHIFGNKPYDKNMLPVESRAVAIMAAGEGWHNFHHSFPWDYRAAELGMPHNLTTTLIDLLAKYGQIYDRKFVSDEVIRKRCLRTGDGSHHRHGRMPEEIPEGELILRKYIVEKQKLDQFRNHLENYAKEDDLNNNNNNNGKDKLQVKQPCADSNNSCNKDLVCKLKDKQALNACSA